MSNESGKNGGYVRPYPKTEDSGKAHVVRWQIAAPVLAPDRSTLYCAARRLLNQRPGQSGGRADNPLTPASPAGRPRYGCSGSVAGFASGDVRPRYPPRWTPVHHGVRTGDAGHADSSDQHRRQLVRRAEGTRAHEVIAAYFTPSRPQARLVTISRLVTSETLPRIGSPCGVCRG